MNTRLSLIISYIKAKTLKTNQKMKMSPLIQLLCLVFCLCFRSISGHGFVIEPPNRSSLWRVSPDAPVNEKDDEVWCGGLLTEWVEFGGQCGVCGDPYGDAHPQDNENTGKYGRGVVVRNYESGSVIDVQVVITINHVGYFNFSLCVLEDPDAPESGEECFIPLTLGDGQLGVTLQGDEDSVSTSVKLPDGLTCDRCVLRWDYSAADLLGQCDDGSFAIGCGNQETFRTCSDISIN